MMVKCERCATEVEAGDREFDHFFCSDECFVTALADATADAIVI